MRDTSTGLHWPTLTLLATATAMATVAVCALARGHIFPAPASVLLYALVFSQVSLLALLLGLGTTPWLIRIGALAAGIAAWVWLLQLTVDAEPTPSATTLVLHAAAVVLVSALARTAGYCWTAAAAHDAAAAPGAARHRQVTIAKLLGWTAVAAVLAALAPRAAWPPADAVGGYVLLLAGTALVGVSAAAAASASHRASLWLAAVILAAAALGLAVGAVIGTHGPGPFVALSVLQALLVAGWIGASRTAGLRIGRSPRRGGREAVASQPARDP